MSGSVEASRKTDNTNGTSATMPILSDYWRNAFGAASTNLNEWGATPWQQDGANFFSGQVANNPVNAAAATANDYLTRSQNNLGFLGSQIAGLTTAAPRQLGAAPSDQAFNAQSFTAQDVDPLGARTGASLAQNYYDPYLQSVVDASVADYNVNADRALNAMRQGRDAAGAFGDRAAIADAVYQADATRGLGNLVSGLRSQGFNTAQGFGQADANRFLSADTANAENLLNNRQFNTGALNQNAQFNANALNQNAQFNTNLLDSRDKFNVDAGYRGDQQRLQANDAVAAYSNQGANLAQQQFQNSAAANASNMDAAQALFNAGGAGQSNLLGMLMAAAAANGSQTNNVQRQTSKGKGASVSGQLK